MGPPPFGDGNGQLRHWVPDDPQSLQWGHRLSAMETRTSAFPACASGAASMGPPPFGDGNTSAPSSVGSGAPTLQWGHRLSAMETLGQHLLRCLVIGASMGPPPFGDGNGPMRSPHPVSLPGFNGATAFRRWKLRNAGSVTRACRLLQWGHRLSAMETPQSLARSITEAWLQWGHRLSAMETADGHVIRDYTVVLQWGHRLSAMETFVTDEERDQLHQP